MQPMAVPHSRHFLHLDLEKSYQIHIEQTYTTMKDEKTLAIYNQYICNSSISDNVCLYFLMPFIEIMTTKPQTDESAAAN